MLTLLSPAKINLTLEVLGREEDGYHRIKSVMQAVGLYDTLTLAPGEEVRLQCTPPHLGAPQNLAFQAALKLKEATGYGGGAIISLKKGIPEGAGLGGGSSDAAAVLRGLNYLWGLGLSTEQLSALAQRVGSDVPFFLYGGTALVEGRGERVTPLPFGGEWWAVLLHPPINLPEKTRRLYSSLSPEYYSQGEAADRLVAALQEGERELSPLLFNVFEKVARALFPGLEEYWARFSEVARGKVNLAGSGPTLYALFRDKASAEEAFHRLKREGFEAYLAQSGVGLKVAERR